MSQIRPKIFVTRRLPGPIEARMATLFEASFNGDDAPLSADALVEGLKGHTVLVSSITDRLDADLISRLPDSVKLIAQFGNGFDNIDIEAAYAAGLTVTNTPSVLTEDTADMAVMLMLALPRRLVEGAQVVPREGNWPGWSPTWMLGRRLRGKALGIVGMGRIGTAVAHGHGRSVSTSTIFRATGGRRQSRSTLEATYWPSLDAMIPEVDIVSAFTPHTRAIPSTSLMPTRLQRLKAGCIRGQRLAVGTDRRGRADGGDRKRTSERGGARRIRQSQRHQLHGCSTLARGNEILLTAHMASATLEARLEMGETVIVNIRAFVDGHQPPHRVLPEGKRLAR